MRIVLLKWETKLITGSNAPYSSPSWYAICSASEKLMLLHKLTKTGVFEQNKVSSEIVGFRTGWKTIRRFQLLLNYKIR
jgi:hypothetical protein